MINDNRMRLTYVLNEKSIIVYVSYEMSKETPQFKQSCVPRTRFLKIKDFSSVECYKEINDTSFSYGFIVFSS